MSAVHETKTLDQRRAKHAWDQLQAFVQGHAKVEQGRKVFDEKAKKYGIHVRKLPTRILASGLGQSLAFLVAKDYCPDLLVTLGDWVLDKRHHPGSSQKSPAPDALLKAIIDKDSQFLRAATAEALAYLQWLIRFAEAEGLTDNAGDSHS